MEWKEVRLEDVCSVITKGTTPSSVGGSFVDSGIKYIRSEMIGFSKHINSDGFLFITDEIHNKLKRSQLAENDILFSMAGAYLGKTAILRKEDVPANTNQAVALIRVNEDFCNEDFIYYCLNIPSLVKYVNSSSAQSAQPNINLKQIGDLLVPYPPIATQRRIANILSSLDRKIELNNKINAQLEEMAQTLFKHWFVDFGPFKDGKFVESELGMIPEGWNIVSLDDLTSKFGTGLNPRKNFVLGKGENYYVTIKNLSDNRVYLDEKCDRVNDEALALINKRSKLMKGDLLFSGVATVGRVALVVDEPKNWHTGETIFNMHPQGVSSEFLYILLLSKLFQEYVKVNLYGSSQQCISMASLKAYKIALPNNDVLKEFDSIIIPIIRKIKSIDKENDSLAKSRDTLLPKLMSGEMKLTE